jgi:DDE superfamily endonuclease
MVQYNRGCIRRVRRDDQEGPLMDQLTYSLAALLEPFAVCFRPEVFATFRLMLIAWIVCLGRRTISRVWETTGRASAEDHSSAFRLFNQAAWNWDELCRILLLHLLTALVPGTTLWLVTDDTLCHKRGAKVAFGGIFLDAVLSTKRHKIFRFGTNWVTLGLAVQLPCRQDRFFCVNILWRVYAKKTAGLKHRTKSQLARDMVETVASWLPTSTLYVVGDSAYVGKHLLKDLPANVHVLGPIHWKAGLSVPLPEGSKGRRKKGLPLSTPRQLLDDAQQGDWCPRTLHHPKGSKQLQVKVVQPVCWYASAGPQTLQVVLVRDPAGAWRDEALLATDLTLSADEVILGYMRRWSVEVAYCESKQLLGLHDPQVWKEESVQRAHPMAWFVAAVVVLWYVLHGAEMETAERERPWYKHKLSPTFADMLACCRLHLWQHWWESSQAEEPANSWEWLLRYVATATG